MDNRRPLSINILRYYFLETAATMALSGAIFLALFVTVFASFDGLDEDGLIPSDGFHDLLGLTPFWMVDKSSVGLRRTLGSEWHMLLVKN